MGYILLSCLSLYCLQSTPEATAKEALGCKPEEHFAWFESLLDDCLERVNVALDNAKRQESHERLTDHISFYLLFSFSFTEVEQHVIVFYFIMAANWFCCREISQAPAGESSKAKDSETHRKKAVLTKKRLPGWGSFSASFKAEKRNNYPFGEDKRVKKPQDQHGIIVDNSDTPFQPK